MTYREKLAEIMGKSLDDMADEVADSCPDDYFKDKAFNCFYEKDCGDCWNEQYNGEEFKESENCDELYDDLVVAVEPNPNSPTNHPSHYNEHNIEVIDFIQDWKLNFCLGNVIKYICRSPYKGKELEDLEKAMKYLEFEIEEVKRNGWK